MDLYTIQGIINNETKKTDEKSKDRIGKVVEFNIDDVKKGKSLTMKDIDSSNYIKTSPVNNIFVDGSDIYIETKNRIYKFTKTTENI